MRTAILKHLKSNVPLVNGEVYQPHMAGPKRKTPYLVLKIAGEVANGHKNAYDRTIEVWPYANPDNYEVIDAITTQVIAAMSKDITTPAGVIELRYIGSGSDYYDPDYKQITNGPIEFEWALIRD
ncbi:hypothetical protein [Weizmannia phage Youna2]